MMSRKDETLRRSCEAFRILANKATDKNARNLCKAMSDLCALALPMKYRFTRDELTAIDSQYGRKVLKGKVK